MSLLLKIKKYIYAKKYKEYVEVQQRLKSKQMESTALFVKVKNSPHRDTATDLELERLNKEANMLALRLIELRKIFEPYKKKD